MSKLLFWIDYNFLHFGISKFFQEKSDHELSAIIEVQPTLQKFFENQEIVKFQKTWFYDGIFKPKKPNIEFLESIEKKYDLNLWEISFMDRLFYSKFNKYHTFTHDEILTIFEQDIHFFENILQKSKPDYIIMHAITSHQQYLFYKFCKKMKIPVFTLEPVRFGDKWMISNGVYNQDENNKEITTSTHDWTSDELIDYLKSNKPARFLFEGSHEELALPKSKKIKAMLKFVLEKNDKEIHYKNFGRTKRNILKKGTARSHIVKTKEREDFIDTNFVTEINNEIKFIYFPLHEEPEKTVLIGAPFYTNQLAVISNIAKSLPVGYQLFVKEHPVMKNDGWREISYYREIMSIPNVQLIHPSIKQTDLIKKCQLVVTIRGTAALESVMYQKPSIVFAADYGWSLIPSITIIDKINNLQNIIRSSLSKKVKPSDLNQYMEFIKQNSFDYPHHKYSSNAVHRFGYNLGYLNDIKISDLEMESFLDENKQLYEFIGKKYVKKIDKL